MFLLNLFKIIISVSVMIVDSECYCRISSLKLLYQGSKPWSKAWIPDISPLTMGDIFSAILKRILGIGY